MDYYYSMQYYIRTRFGKSALLKGQCKNLPIINGSVLPVIYTHI